MIASDRLAHTSRWRTRPLAEKSLLALGLLALAVTLPPWPGAALVLAVAVGAALAAGTPLPALLRLMAGPAAFILTGSAALLVEVGDGIRLSPAGAEQAGQLALRAFAAIAAMLLLAVTTPASELVQGLRRLGLSAEVAEVALATYRFLFVLQDTATAINATQAARLGHVGWRRRIRSSGLLAASLLPRAMDRAHRLEQGLAARGFDGSLRTLSPRRPASLPRLALIAALLLAMGASAWI